MTRRDVSTLPLAVPPAAPRAASMVFAPAVALLAPMLLASIFLVVVPTADADEPPSFALTTDTAAYCAQLARQVAERHSPLADVQRLLSEGRDMCDSGQIRGGIRRLRRALVILHHKPLKDE